MENITYSLKGNQNNSDGYYENISEFTDEVLSESKHFLGPLVDKFKSYVKENNLDQIQSYEEYVFELLMIGTLWRVYGAQFSKLDKKSQKILENLANLRKKYESLKSSIDILRGILMTLFLVQNHENTIDLPDLTLNNFDKLLKFLQATGEFSQEIKKLKIWREFLAAKTPETISEYLANVLSFAEWFETRSEVVLGEYTQNVATFLKEKYQKRLWKKNVISSGRKPVEYHFSMVGAEIMNRAFKKDFGKRSRKALLLPSCMRSKMDKECKAGDTNLGLKCVKCSKECNIRQLTDMGMEYDFEVYIVSHESSTFSKITKEDMDELGIIGVACISRLIAGGLKSESLGIPAQCVILDYTGCKRHWHDEDFPTSININRLMYLLNLNKIPVKSDEKVKAMT